MFWFVQNCVLLSIGASIESAKLSLLVCSGDLRAKSGNCKPLATSLKSNHRQLQYISQQHKTLKPRGTEKKQLLISSYHFTVIEEPLQLMSGCFPINFLKLFFCFSSFYGGWTDLEGRQMWMILTQKHNSQVTLWKDQPPKDAGVGMLRIKGNAA